MGLTLKKAITILFWILFSFLIINQLIVSMFATAVYYRGANLSNEFSVGFAGMWARINLALVPMLVIVFGVLEYKGRLPRFSLKKETDRAKSRTSIFLRKIYSILWRWVVFGLIPFLIVMALSVFFMEAKSIVLVPAGLLYLEYILLLIIFKQLTVKVKS